MSEAQRAWLAAGVIALAVLTIYAPVRDYPFVVYDDKALVSENPVVTAGLVAEGVRSAFVEPNVGNWVPLTWLSHMLDVELFGLEAGGHHVVNVLLHVGASLLLLAAFLRMTGALGPSAFVAAVFAVHPLHVESVAWIAERRDVLSGFFFALSLLAYASWAGRSERRALWGAVLLGSTALGLLAKPMLVTLPFVLLLLDVWPLRRTDLGARLVVEKLPLFLLAGLATAATVATQSDVGAVASLSQVPLDSRVANAFASLAAYLGKTLWPGRLSVFYPYDLSPPLWQTGLAAGLVLALSVAAAWQARRRPWLLVGWLWYLGMLVPVIGLVQVGSQGMADRYTYLPMIGLCAAAAFSADGWARTRNARRAVLVVTCLWLLALVGLARTQVGTWRDSVVLFEHARAVVGEEPVVMVNLGEAYDDAGRSEEAIVAYRAGLEEFPHARYARTRLGILLAASGRAGEAILELERAIQMHPEEAGARTALAGLALEADNPERAAELLEAELEASPGEPLALFRRGELNASQGRAGAAQRDFVTALRADPQLPDEPVLGRSPQVALALANALAELDRRDPARLQGRRALSLARLSNDEAQARAAADWLAAFPAE